MAKKTLTEAQAANWYRAWIAAREALDYLIMATPSGETRNALTSANIWLMEAREGLLTTAPLVEVK